MRGFYIVRGNIWMESGMGAWDAGFLHLHCLEKRLGRKLTDHDLLVWVIGETADGIKMCASRDYLTSPEYLEHED